jgi:tetratricopeptide (TPR) repeat protein
MRNSILCIVALVTVSCAQPASAKPDSGILYREASARARSGDIDGAIVDFKKIIDLSPRYALGHYGLGKAYLCKKGELKNAIYHLRQSVACDRDLGKGYFYLGLAYMFSEKYALSLDAFMRAYTADRSIVEALYNIAVVYDMIRQDSNSTKYYDRFMTAKYKKDTDLLF